MSVNIKIGDVTLDNHIYWSNKHLFNRDVQELRWSIFGLPLLYHSRRPSWTGGRIIVLESQEDAGWQLISTAKALQLYNKNLPVGESFIFTYYDENYECVFFSDGDEPSVSYEPVSRNAILDTHWCLLRIGLIVSQLKTYQIEGTMIGE